MDKLRGNMVLVPYTSGNLVVNVAECFMVRQIGTTLVFFQDFWPTYQTADVVFLAGTQPLNPNNTTGTINFASSSAALTALQTIASSMTTAGLTVYQNSTQVTIGAVLININKCRDIQLIGNTMVFQPNNGTGFLIQYDTAQDAMTDYYALLVTMGTVYTAPLS